MPRLLWSLASSMPVEAIGDALRAWEEQPLEADAKLHCAPLEGAALSIGAFGSAKSSLAADAGAAVVRAAGGPPISLATGQVYLALQLASPASLGANVDVARALNRHVRPLLAAMSAASATPASFGGRDFVSVRGSPVAWVGLRHRAGDDRTSLEAVVSVSAPFDVDPAIDLAASEIAPRWLGKRVGSLVGLGAAISARRLCESIVDAYVATAASDAREEAFTSRPTLPLASPRDVAFSALVEEGVGLVGASFDARGLHLGGELYASFDRLATLSTRLGATIGAGVREPDRLRSIVDAELGPGRGAWLHGVRSLESFVRVSLAAAARSDPRTAQKSEEPD
jgi:hypothetical protein